MRPKSAEAARAASQNLVNGVPMQWMTDWSLPFTFFIKEAENNFLNDIDGNTYVDFCLGDTGSMFGHSPEPVAKALEMQARKGFTHMLPTVEATDVGALLSTMFGLPAWQLALTATDANRFALRLARAVTQRRKILVFNGCYHGTVDETFVRLSNGQTAHRPGLLGQFQDLTADTVVIEFNDLDALEQALRQRDIACVIAEPVMTNCSMILPDEGYHADLRRLTKNTGTLLLIDETHTISSGYGGYTRTHGLEPDIWVCGKAIAGGVPTAVWGMSDWIHRQCHELLETKEAGHSGMGTTLAGNALSLAALRANLTEVMTPENFGKMEQGAADLDDAFSRVITKHRLPWHIARVGARVEIIFSDRPLRNGTDAQMHHFTGLERAVHLGLLNRGILIAPFHNMMLVSPHTTSSDVQCAAKAFASVVSELAA